MLSTISNGIMFLIPIMLAIYGIVAAWNLQFMIVTVVCSWCAVFFILGFGGIIKLVNKKVWWNSFKIYSNVLLIIGGVFAVINIIYTVICVNHLNLVDILSIPIAATLYGTFSVGFAICVPLATIGVLLELIYREKHKNVFKGFSVSLITVASEVLAVTLGIIIWIAVTFF